MRSVLDKVLLLFCGCALLQMQPLTIFSIAAFLAAVTISAICSVMCRRWFCYASGALYLLLCAVKPEFCVFLPLVFYDAFTSCHPLFCAASLLPVLTAQNALSSGVLRTAMIMLFISIAYFQSRRNRTLEQLHTDMMKMRDSSKEAALLLEYKNKQLMEKQDYEVRLATLAERNRIAREIHDNVGHMLSRSILQVGALMALNHEETVGKALDGLQNTLSLAMDSIRSSVHDLHDESIDLHVQVQSLVREFVFCPVKLEYDVDGVMDKELKYTFLAIIKEALSNVARHSNATQVKILLREHPALYQLIIQDNGTGVRECTDKGIGLQNITDRVNAYHGNFNVERNNGFKLFVSIPKGGTAE